MKLILFSGLRIVGVDFAGEGILNIDTFTVGTNDNIFVVLNATCCVRKALLSMIDVAGNANRAEFNKGPLKGILFRYQITIIIVNLKHKNIF